jgi:hypothetical protein
MVGAHLLVSQPAGGILEHLFQEFHKAFQSNFLSSLLSRILASAIFPTRVDLLLQRDDFHYIPNAYSYPATLVQGIDLIYQSSDVREFNRSRLFTPSPLVFRESAYKGREVGFMVLTIEPGPMPSSKRSLHWVFKKIASRVSLEIHTLDSLLVSGTRLIFQEKIMFEQRKVWRDA